ncbi:hypothetical protein [Nocardia sp. NBC_01329]|uniref:hypothetical protein n=1 Tax=Nocardia sp. NBC_01329 TaxID=2903594 RepID=UPI002E1622DE|nr:hypothetical protein OG405_16000 [Nocardia sp. NBC_01329]
MDNAAIGLIRPGVTARDVDLYALAAMHGYRLVFTVEMDTTNPLLAMHGLARHAAEWGARAVAVPDFAHCRDIFDLITENAVLVTPGDVYPRGYRWPPVSNKPIA